MIVPVKKIRLIAPQAEQETLIKTIQHESKFMLFDYSEEASLPSDLSHELKRIERGIDVLSKFQKKKFFSFHEVTRKEFEQSEKQALSILSKVDDCLNTIETKEEENVKLDDQIKTMTPYLNIGVATKELEGLVKTRIVIGHLALVNFEAFMQDVNEKGFIFEESSRDAEFVYGAFGYEFIYENQAIQLLNSYRFNEVSLPLYNTKLSGLLPELNKNLADNNKIIARKQEELKTLSADVNVLRAYYDYFYNKAARSKVKFEKTERVAYVEGWVREDEIEALKVNLGKNVYFELEELTVAEDENPPTATKNNRFVRYFESITNMFSVPNHKELDPNPVMSVWYWIIFGIMMGDVGYGLVMLVVFTLFLKLKKPKGSLKQLATIFAYSSIPSIIFGVITGSVFGVTVDFGNIIGGIFGNPDLSFILLQPVDDPLPMLIFSLGLGVVHIISGLILKVINEVRRKDYLSMLADGVSWIAILVGIVLMIVTKVKIVNMIGIGLIATGVLLILFLNGRNSKNFLGKAMGGLGGIYNVTSYLSDILSYSRLLALSLSTAVIAYTMNLLAGMVMGVPIVGIIFALVIYLIGHIFNFAMGLLSAYVHDGRLQYLEFFGKFYEGGGYDFTPFSYKLKYLDAIKENE